MGGPPVSPGALGQRPSPARSAGRSGRGLCCRGAAPPQVAAALLAVCRPRVAGDP